MDSGRFPKISIRLLRTSLCNARPAAGAVRPAFARDVSSLSHASHDSTGVTESYSRVQTPDRLQTPLSTRCERVADALAWYHTSHRFGLLSRLWLAVRFTNMANERRKRWKGAQVQSCLATIQRSTAIFIPPFISATHLLRSLGQDFFVPSSMQPRLPPAQAASCSLERHLAQTR